LHCVTSSSPSATAPSIRRSTAQRRAQCSAWRGLAVGKKLKKMAVLTGNAFGFIGNRIYSAYRRQSSRPPRLIAQALRRPRPSSAAAAAA
jgi:hypothetical protein